MPAQSIFVRPFPQRTLLGIFERQMLRLTLQVLVKLAGGLISPGWRPLEAMTNDRFGTG